MIGAVSVAELLAGLTEAPASSTVSVTGLALDSRRVTGGELFLAYPGGRLDGRDFIEEAVGRGAVGVAYEPDGFEYHGAVPGIAVKELAAKTSEIGARFYGRPAAELLIVGVTGTNGKTSCVHFLAQCLERLGARVRMIGTLGSGEVWAPRTGGQGNSLTTPSPLDLQELLRQFADDGTTHVVMEVSSHALKQGRVAAVDFDAAVFTNLTRDHLDYHDGVDEYAAVKKSLFDWASLRVAVVNGDDPVGQQIQRESASNVLTFGDRGDIRATDLSVSESGLAMQISTPYTSLPVSVSLVGRVNAVNVLAVAGVLLELAFDPVDVEQALNQLLPVPGRMELFRSPQGGPTVVVDYAHTPDALERALESVREHCSGGLWCVFGCGGDRDRGKRPEMGRVAEKWADHLVLTNDNPRNEPPAQIVAEILDGITGDPRVVLDRRQAIASALADAGNGDWVLIAGKGHETYQIVGDKVMSFDDREIVSGCLEKAA